MYQREVSSKSDIHAVEFESEQILTIDITRQNKSSEDSEVPTKLFER